MIKLDIQMFAENETFGVKIEAIVDGFKSKMNEVKQIGEKVKHQFKEGWNIEPKINTKNLSEMELKTKGLKNILKASNFEVDIKDPIGVKRFSSNISKLNGKTILLKNNINKIENSFSNVNKKISQTKSTMDKVKKATNGVGDTISKMGQKATSSLKKLVLGVIGVRSVFLGLRKAVSSYLEYDSDLSKKLSASWAGLGAQLAPVIEFIINLFAKAVAYINAFVAALTGINMIARANTKALNNQAKATGGAGKAANKALASFDELNNINQDSGGGAGGGPDKIDLPTVETTGMEAIIEKLKKLFETLFEPIKASWDKYGTGFINSFKNMLISIGGLINSIGKSLLEVWTNGTGEQFVSNLLIYWTNLFDIVSGIAKALTNAWESAGNGTAIIQSIANIFISMQELSISIAESIKKWVLSENFQTALTGIVNIIRTLIGYIEKVAKWITDMYNQYLSPVVDEALDAISEVIIAIEDIWEAVKPVVDKVIDVILKSLEPVIKNVANTIKGIITIIKGIAEFVSGVFKGDWEKAWQGIKNIFNGIWTAIKGIVSTVFNQIISIVKTAWTTITSVWGTMASWVKSNILDPVWNGVKSVINKIISGINVLIKGLNKVKFDVPDWVPVIGGKKWGFDIKQIASLDVGTNYVPEDQLAMIHKGEAVIPKKFNSAEYFNNYSNNEETNALLKQLIGVVDEKEFSASISANDIGKTSVDYINKQSRIAGRSVV